MKIRESSTLNSLAEGKDTDSLEKLADASGIFPAEDCEDYDADDSTHAGIVGFEEGVAMASKAIALGLPIYRVVKFHDGVFFFIGDMKSVKAKINGAEDAPDDDDDNEEDDEEDDLEDEECCRECCETDLRGGFDGLCRRCDRNKQAD